MQQQKLKSRTNPLVLSSRNAARASELIREGKASLEISVYPWGVEFAVASPCCQIEELEEGASDAV
jgi:hypothetical protein